MVIDNIKRFRLYEGMHPLFSQAFAFIESYLEEPKPVGRYEILGDDLFALVQRYETKAEAGMEAHDKYIDIQFMVKGKECIDCEDCASMTVTEDKMAESDIAFYENPEKYSVATLFDGDFVIIFPEEAHRPMRAYDEKPMAVKKAVAKIKL